MLGVLAVLACVAMGVSASGAQVSVSLPYLNPAGVEYVASAAPGLAAIDTHAAGLTSYAAAPAAYLQHQPAYAAIDTHAAGLTSYAAAPAAYLQHQPAYAAALETVHHVPAEAHVPVTSVQAHHGVVSDVVDVAKPAVQTRRFEVRRPAIQKQFYDIEERVVIRPAGSALLELEEPIAKVQKGPAVVHDIGAHAVAGVPVAAHGIATQGVAVAAAPVALSTRTLAAHAVTASPALAAVHAAPAIAVTSAPSLAFAHSPGVAVTTAGFAHSPALSVGVVQGPTVAITPAPILATPTPIYGGPSHGVIASTPAPPPAFDQSDSVVVENADLARSLPLEHRQQIDSRAQGNAAVRHRQEELNQRFLQEAAELQLRGQQEVARQQLLSRQHATDAIVATTAAPIYASTLAPTIAAPVAVSATPLSVSAHPVVPSVRNSPEVNHHNQAKLIDLLTEKGGVADVGFGRAGPAGAPVGDAGISRGRVLAAAREAGHPIGERVNTRRVVVSRPIETVQEFDVFEPATKLERVEVHQPAVFKSLRQDIARVPTSIPVQSKTLVPAVATATAIPFAHAAAVPVAHAGFSVSHAPGIPLTHASVTAAPYLGYH